MPKATLISLTSSSEATPVGLVETVGSLGSWKAFSPSVRMVLRLSKCATALYLAVRKEEPASPMSLILRSSAAGCAMAMASGSVTARVRSYWSDLRESAGNDGCLDKKHATKVVKGVAVGGVAPCDVVVDVQALEQKPVGVLECVGEAHPGQCAVCCTAQHDDASAVIEFLSVALIVHQQLALGRGSEGDYVPDGDPPGVKRVHHALAVLRGRAVPLLVPCPEF
eukprot:1844713-Rhodomonas_salina.1